MAVRESERAYIVFRGTGCGGRVVEVHLIDAPAAGNMADAWARLSRLDPSVDPRSIEIETRRRLRPAARTPVRPGPSPSPPIDFARWLAERAAMAHHPDP